MNKKLTVLAALATSALYVQAQNILKIEAGATLKTTGGVIITLHNTSLINDGTINQAAGEGIFRFTGDQHSTISGTAPPTFDEITLAKTGGAHLILQRNINVVSKINFNSGLFDLNSNNINLGTAALLMGESESSRIIGSTGGTVLITKTLNAPVSENPGNVGAILTSAQNMGSVTIGRGHQSQTGGGLSSSVLRYFDISPANNTGLNATLRFQYLDAELNSLDENTLVMWKSPDNLNWISQAFSSRNTTSNYVEKTGINDFSRWTLSGSNNIPLPLVWGSFNTQCLNSTVIVRWKTLQESNTSSFIIQRSGDGRIWTQVGMVPAAGNRNTEKSYSFIHNNPVPQNYYRIAQYDTDGRIHYSSILRVSCNVRDVFTVWPNPFHEMVLINISTGSESQATVKVFDKKGALIKIQNANLLQGSNQLNIDMKKVAGGTYQLAIEWNNGQMKKTVQVVKR